ncbi:aryl-alcohol dehydrogenase-like predicted oxidoreductase [Deinococcus metalli]|uniref:Aryl-alcohol dehydrogenase-like predicted oxidoreductase n=1 Tax=Deinococcus metalli TaxID=1141878 RepID=A0A7W8KGX6_9DEIO|nr:aldo/keto reductase [Deinococcus metalli]MBB5377593.1 aryl-alcohol dehydrogenase-like predicted oxidoreductase [Deinococcus metalli]GHF51937.1 NADP-dependent aryl-alcohol dehydrogenase [Deinococcus metalli]
MTTYRQLGRSGLHLFPLGLGTMQFGWSADEAASQSILDHYVGAGGNFIDTADIYTMWTAGNPGGISEEIIGRWMKDRGNRDDLVIATKVRGAMGEFGKEGRSTIKQREGLSRRWILKACEDSLRRLQTDHIDLYQVHWIDALVPIEETLSALTDLVRRGYVRYLGCSNYSAWRLMQALWVSDTRHLERFVSIQPEYSLLSPTRANFERELQRVCVEYGLGVVPWSPLGGGLLTGKYRRGQPLPDSVRAGEAGHRLTEQNDAIIGTLETVAARHGAKPAQVALAWLLQTPAMTAPIIGANSVAQLDDLLGTLTLTLTPEDVAEINTASDWERARTEREN